MRQTTGHLRRQLTSIRGLFAFLLLGLPTLTGCQDPPQVVVQTRPRTEPAGEPFDAEAWRNSRDHILVAMAIRGDFAWFFKLPAPAEGIEELRKKFDSWLESIEFSYDEEQDAEVPDWENPQGWFNTRGNDDQYAVVRLPGDPVPLTLSITRLPVTTKPSRYITMNVNRWLRQLGMRSFDDAAIEELQQERPLKEGTAQFFELSGRLQIPPPWRVAKSRSRRMQSKEIRFEIPKGWEPGRMNAMRKLSLVRKAGDEEGAPVAAIVVTAFPASGMMGDTLANVKRWAGEAGIAEEDEQLLDRADDYNIGGLEGVYVRLVPESKEGAITEKTGGPEGSNPEAKKALENDSDSAPLVNRNAVIAAMVKRSEQMWFFKLNGPSKIVVDSEAAFKEFLDSFEFRESE